MTTNHRNRIGVLAILVMTLQLSAARQTNEDEPLHVWKVGSEIRLALPGGRAFHVTLNDVRNQRIVNVPGSPITLILWEEHSNNGDRVSFFAISPDGRSVARVRKTSYLLKLRHGDFDPAKQSPAVAPSLAASENGNLFIVQFLTQPLEEFRDQITVLGGTVRQFLANHAHIVEMPPATRDLVAALPYVRWIGPYHPAYRLEEFLQGNPERDDESFPRLRYNIQVFEAGERQKRAVAGRIGTLGGVVDRVDAGKFLLEATLTLAQLHEVATWDEVLFIDRWSPYQTDMNNARALGGANYIESVAGFTGGGVRGEVFDAGFNLSHVDFASRPLILHGQVDSSSHGAATSGIVFGDGTGNANARGLLPDGQGIVADYGFTSMTGSGRYNHTGELVQAPYDAVFQTASVGSARTLQYTTISADTDAALFDFDIVHCQSQSNAGDQMSRPQAWAKNIISGGGVRHYNTLTVTDDCWCGGASIGPASDGRIKPDLCAFYDNILTTTTGSSTAYTSTFGGTSGATPIIAGHVGLFFDMWADGIFGNPFDPQGTVFDNRAHMTTAKAMLINNASQYPFSGTNHDLTRVHQGWGRPDVQRMYDMRAKMFIIDETDLLGNLESIAYGLTVDPGEPELRATLVYADPPGVPSSSQHRINDLTLRVTSPSATVYWGNVGLLSGNYSTPGGSPNTIDTVENVFVLSPEAGTWTVEVLADEVNQDGHVETPALDADFALVVSGVVGSGPLQNRPPTVDAGPDQTIVFPEIANLDGTVTDDGLPDPPMLVTTWRQLTGAGTVTFGDANAIDTTAEFSEPDTYILELEAFDGELYASDQVTITVSDGTVIIDDVADGEIFVRGTVAGSYVDTWNLDGVDETITERESGGKPANRHSMAEHKWIFNVQGGNVVQFYLTGHRSGSGLGDDFIFAYSTNDANYVAMFTVSETVPTEKLFLLPASINGTVYVRVVDTDRTPGNRALDSIHVDQMYFRSETSLGDPPAAPTNLAATAVSSSQLDLSWNDNSQDESGFEIDRSADGVVWANIATVAANMTSHADTSLASATTYFYRVRAVNSGGASAYSNTANATTLPGGNIVLSGVGRTQGRKQVVDLTWTGATSANVDIYRNDELIATTPNDGSYRDQLGRGVAGTFVYEVCDQGTVMCSNTVTVNF